MIRPMTPEERKRSIEREKANHPYRKCVSCGGPSRGDFCEFCLNEE